MVTKKSNCPLSILSIYYRFNIPKCQKLRRVTLDQDRLSFLGAFDRTRVQKRRKLNTEAVSELATIFVNVSSCLPPLSVR